MSRREVVEKPLYRFIPVDDTIYTWAIFDRLQGIKIEDGFRDSMAARQRAEELNRDPSLIDG